MLIHYRDHRFNAKAETTVQQANHIIHEMQAQGYTLTLRQLYYQFVRRNWIENSEKQYKRLGRLMTHARESGVTDWLAIEDRGRQCMGYAVDEDAASVVGGIEFDLNFDFWSRQSTYLEVWVEKQALEGVIAKPCQRLKTPYMACKGYLSASEAWRAGQRYEAAIACDKNPVLIHLADHDPSGLNMTEDNENRIHLFARNAGVNVRRIALNMDQVDTFKPPPNPAKESDSRSAQYVKRYGPSSWELDALEPKFLTELITDTIEEYIDPDVWAETRAKQTEAREPLAALSENWDQVRQFMYDTDLI